MTEKFLPKWIAWEVTQRCNLKCVHCRASSDDTAAEGDFTTEQALTLLDDIAELSTPVVVLSGGEPLLRKDVFTIAARGTELGLRMCMATNGVLIDDAVCEEMKKSQIRMVSLSLDGSTAKTHDDFRQQPGAFDGTLRGIEFLKKHGIPFLINSSFTKRNQGDIGNIFRLAKSLGATAWYMFMIVPTGRGEDIFEELISKEDYEDILKWHYQMEKELQEGKEEILVRPTCAPHYYRIVPQMAKAEGSKFERRTLSFSTGGAKGCIAAQSICLIDAFGDVKPCSYFPLSAGNVKEKKFRDIWEHSPLFEELRDFTKYKGRCGSCEYLRVCGGCRARAYAVTGDYLDEEPFCNYVPFRMRRGLEKKP